MQKLNVDWWAMFQILVVVVLGVLLANYISQQVAKNSTKLISKKVNKVDDTTIPETPENVN
jgi:hypothetical protein